ncbi:JAB domain-containing protein [Marinihelvus fidelis]|nr:JAB domain-containing protein [Marinihelvus fidelis]
MKEQDRVIVEQALKILRDELGTVGVELTDPAAAGQYCQLRLGDREHEVFLVVFLDTRHRVRGAEELFRGTIDGACVYPREVAKAALMNNAAAVIVAHNHPSGVTEPSMADQAITRRLKDALTLLEIRLLDHFVVSGQGFTSMASRGMI